MGMELTCVALPLAGSVLRMRIARATCVLVHGVGAT